MPSLLRCPPHQPCHRQSLPKGLRTKSPALQWGRGWTREPTHNITVDLSSGKVIWLTSCYGKGRPAVRGKQVVEMFFAMADSGFSPRLEQMEGNPEWKWLKGREKP